MTDCYCDFEEPDFYVARIHTARKPHRCEECRREIKPGEQYEYVSASWGHIARTYKTCEHCRDLRIWTQNNVPCLCWSHGNSNEDCYGAVEEAVMRGGDEVRGLRFGFLRRVAKHPSSNVRTLAK